MKQVVKLYLVMILFCGQAVQAVDRANIETARIYQKHIDRFNSDYNVKVRNNTLFRIPESKNGIGLCLKGKKNLSNDELFLLKTLDEGVYSLPVSFQQDPAVLLSFHRHIMQIRQKPLSDMLKAEEMIRIIQQDALMQEVLQDGVVRDYYTKKLQKIGIGQKDQEKMKKRFDKNNILTKDMEAIMDFVLGLLWTEAIVGS